MLSATSVIKAIDRNIHDVVCIGITRENEFRLYEGNIDNIADGSWEKESQAIDIGKLPEMIDFALPILHGAYGEDGTIQGLFEMLNLPYAGSGVLGSSLAMDKVAAKQVFVANKIPTCDYKLVYAEEVSQNALAVAKSCETLPYPMFVKPANMGSSKGISKVRTTEELVRALELAAGFDRRIIVEEGINCREVETGVIGNARPEAARVGEIVAKADFYDYDAKYSDDAGTMIIVPADIPKDMEESIRKIAIDAYLALDCAGFARVDFLVDKETGTVYVSEINTIPGFTKYSMFPLLWQERGVSFGELVERIVNYGYERYNVKNNR